MSTKPRTPEHFPRMKHRAAKRRCSYMSVIIAVDLKPFIEACREASEALAKMMACREAGRTISPPPLEPTQPTTEAAPNRAASFMPGDIVTVNNPGSVWHGESGRVRYSLNVAARVDFGDMHSALIAHIRLTKGEREC